jgi:hypothetical protein
MSGSPVFDNAGRVVAIHGKPGHDKENQYDFERCQPLTDAFANNWGISMETFLNSSLTSNLKLQVDEKPHP